MGHAVVVAWLLEKGGAAGTMEARNEVGDTAFLLTCDSGIWNVRRCWRRRDAT
jgi:hypothetical protein